MVINAEKLEALRKLANSPDGCTVSIMIGVLQDLVGERLASAHHQNVAGGRRTNFVTRLRITDLGRLVLAG
jgi:hypothetical protein